MEDFYRPSLIGRGGPIAPTTVPGTDFVLKIICTYTSIAPVEVLGKQTAYTIQSVRPQPGPSHPNSIYYLESDKSDEDEPSEVLVIQRSIHRLSSSPTSSFDPIVGSLSSLPTPFGDSDSLLEETDTLFSHSDDSLPDYETFCFDIEEKSSGSTTSHSDHSLPDYEAFCFDIDHMEEKSSCSTTSKYHFSLLEYESFHFDLSIDQFPPADMSDLYHEQFADELAHIISLLEYDHFYFDLKDDPVEVTKIFKENIPKTSTEDLTRNELNDFPLILSDCDSNFSKELFEINMLTESSESSEIVSLSSSPFENEDKVFDPGIHILGRTQIVKNKSKDKYIILEECNFLFISSDQQLLFFLELTVIETLLSFSFENEDKVFKPGILISNGVHHITLELSHRTYETFNIINVHPNTFNEGLMKIFPFFCFCPKDKGIREILYGESKVHIEVLSVLWENRLPISDGSLPLSRYSIQIFLVMSSTEVRSLVNVPSLNL
nr:hypothetical protein [Tanacetum cinerariifolium]